MMIPSSPLSRRTMLRGAGTMLALPMLDAMMPARASAAPLPPARLTIFYLPNGMINPSFVPTKVGPGLELSPILKSLAPFKSKLTVVTGLTQPNGNALGDGGGDHARGAGSYLTAAHPKKSDSDIHSGVSMDQYVAQELGKNTQVASLEIGVEPSSLVGSCDPGYSCAYSGTLSWSTPTTPLPTVVNPREVFERLFGDSDTIDRGSRLAQLRRNASILDFISEDTKRLTRKISIDDRRKIDEYMTSVRDLERRIQLTESQSGDMVVSDMKRPMGAPIAIDDHINMMLDLQVLALRADITRVSSFMIGQEGSNRSYTQIGISDAHHALSHHGGDVQKIAKLVKIQTFLVQYYAKYLKKLQDAKEGDGTLLDRTLAWCGASLGDPNLHEHENLSLMLAGGLFKGDRHIAADKALLSNVMISAMNAVGVKRDRLGDSTGPFAALDA